jgi:hypothetical protein
LHKITICLVLYKDLQYDGRIQERHDSKTTQSTGTSHVLKDSPEIVLIRCILTNDNLTRLALLGHQKKSIICDL